MPYEDHFWQRKQKKRKTVATEPRVTTVSHWHTNENCTNTLMHNMERFSKVPRIQNAHSVLLDFRKQLL